MAERSGPANLLRAAAVQLAMARWMVITGALMAAVPAAAAPRPPLVVLAPAGETRNRLPALTRRPAGEVDRVLARGFSGRLLRLYALEQEYLRRETGADPEPAYLLLSTRQGGFPRFGFVLDGAPKPDAGYVDLHHRSMVAGRFGAMDQVFPHELLHVITRQLAGEPRESGANQVHAVGVRTDPVVAFQEGFAEHAQIMSVDDGDAVPATQALRDDVSARARAERETDRYRRSAGGRFWLGGPSEMRFLLWFSSAEQVMRYHAVKENLFARQAPLPARVSSRGDKYWAYLLQSVVPGSPADPLKPPGVQLSTEGVVAHLFWRWVTEPGLQSVYRDEEFYARFGTTALAVDPLDNAYLKIFHAMRCGRAHDTAAFLRAYIREFPDEALLVQHVVTLALGGQDVPDAPELWLANPALQTGTSLFDQFRALPRIHTFDANAATLVDWMAVPGVSAEVAARLLAAAPYRDARELRNQAWLDSGVRQRLEEMEAAMTALRNPADAEESLSLAALLRAYVWRLLLYVLASAAAGAWLAVRLCSVRWRWAVACGLVSALVVFALAWVIESPAWMPVAAPVLLGGVPSAAWTSVRRRSWRGAPLALAAWAAAAVPAVALSRSWP